MATPLQLSKLCTLTVGLTTPPASTLFTSRETGHSQNKGPKSVTNTMKFEGQIIPGSRWRFTSDRHANTTVARESDFETKAGIRKEQCFSGRHRRLSAPCPVHCRRFSLTTGPAISFVAQPLKPYQPRQFLTVAQ